MNDLANSPAIRKLPLTLCLQALFGGAVSQLGWFFFGFGLIFVWGFVLNSEAVTFWKFQGPLKTVPGTVVQSRETGASEGDVSIYAIDYTFVPPGGASIRGTSYEDGSNLTEGANVTVQYREGHPAYSRIEGMRSAEFSWPVVFVLIFPGIGLALIIYTILKGLRSIAMASRGAQATGTLVAISPVSEVNGTSVKIFSFEFATPDGRKFTTSYSTANPKGVWLRVGLPNTPSSPESLAMQEKARSFPFLGKLLPPTSPPPPPPSEIPPEVLQETILYNPRNPADAFFPAEFGPHVSIDPAGNIESANQFIGVKAAILPLIVLAGHGYFLFVHFFR